MKSKVVQSFGPELKGLLFISPWIVGLLWFYLYPFIASLYYSFHNATAFGSGAFIGFRNYEVMVRDPLFWKSLVNTIYFTSGSLGLGTLLSLELIAQRYSGVPPRRGPIWSRTRR
jgi:ABC-type sugar transport system permease subunit